MEQLLENVRAFAERAHGDQKRKYSHEPYMVHPIQVMETLRDYTDDVFILAAALLHDVLEDTGVTKDEIRQFLGGIMSDADADRTVQLVTDLTDVYTKKNYPQLNRRTRKSKEISRLAATHEDVQLIKYADVMDNAKNIFFHDPDFSTVYLHEAKNLLERMRKGNAELFDKCLKTVNDCLDMLENKEEQV